MTSTENKAVFLSYASQDAAAVERIAEALRAAGVEVWFDKDELVGGDAWDQKIRRQIKECAIFVPIISAATATFPCAHRISTVSPHVGRCSITPTSPIRCACPIERRS